MAVAVRTAGIGGRSAPSPAPVKAVTTINPVSDLLANSGSVAASVHSSLAGAAATPVAPVIPTAKPVIILPQATGLTGAPNNPPTPQDSNAPGLNNYTGGLHETMKSHWLWIAAIVLVLLAFWYFSGSGSTASA